MFSWGIYLQRYLSRSKRYESVSIFYYHRQSFFIGLFDKLLETKQTNTFVSLSGSLLGSSLEPCLTSTRFVIYLNHLWWPGLDSSPTFSHAGSRRILLSWEILLISHFGTHFRLGSVSSFKALPLYIQNKNRWCCSLPVRLRNPTWSCCLFLPAPWLPFGHFSVMDPLGWETGILWRPVEFPGEARAGKTEAFQCLMHTRLMQRVLKPSLTQRGQVLASLGWVAEFITQGKGIVVPDIGLCWYPGFPHSLAQLPEQWKQAHYKAARDHKFKFSPGLEMLLIIWAQVNHTLLWCQVLIIKESN